MGRAEQLSWQSSGRKGKKEIVSQYEHWLQGMVISVPHSGTRSVKALTGLTTQWHWGENEDRILKYDGLAHIPIRHPVDIQLSWLARYSNEADFLKQQEKTAVGLVPDLLQRQLDWIKGRGNVVLHKIEDLHIHEGKGPDKDRRGFMCTDQVVATKRWMLKNMDFYGQFYG